MIRVFIIVFCLVAPIHAAPDVDSILRKFIDRCEDPVLSELRDTYAYQRTSVVEYLEENGGVKSKRVRIYRVAPENGEPVTRLISVNGRPATEKADKKRSAARETGEKSRTLGISEDVLSRYEFTFVREELFASRSCWVLAFAARKDAPNEEFFDKLINAMSGTIWIDQEDSQLAKAQLHLSKRVSFFGGIAGAIDKLDLTLIQRRIEPSVWLGEAIHIDFSGRKLFSPVRFRCVESCGGFEKVPLPETSARPVAAK